VSFTAADLLERTAARIPDFGGAEIHPIERGGSSRRFFRVRSGRRTVILVHDPGEKEENRHYAAAASFLILYGVPVPKVMAASPGEGLLWLEDLGERDLWTFRNEPWERRRTLYESALRGVAKLHLISPKACADAGVELQKGFDETLYLWEQEYFAEHCLGGLFSLSRGSRDSLLGDHAMEALRRGLAARPTHLMHRDFQSQNILIRGEEACFIDFQGMRLGLPEYDLASLLCDPYVTVPVPEVERLLGCYREIRSGLGHPVRGDFPRIFWQCAVQRLMQALGAYGNLSLHCGKPAFRSHVTPALLRLKEALSRLHPDDRLDVLADLVKDLPL